MEEKSIKVSICIPIYNAEKYIKKCIDSILIQTYKNIEILIVDNCSTDNSPQIISQYVDQRIKYIRNEKNLGACGNWNRCIESSTGELIAIYHADDEYLPEIVEKQVNILQENNEIGAVFCEAVLIDSASIEIGNFLIPKQLRNKKIIAFEEIFYHMILNNSNPLLCPSAMIRKSAYEKSGHYDCNTYKWVFDIDMYLRIAQKMKIGIIHEKLMNYRLHNAQGSVSYAMDKSDQNEVFSMLDKYISKLEIDKKDLDIYDCHKKWDLSVHAIKAAYRNEKEKSYNLVKKSLSVKRIKTSLSSFGLFTKLILSLVIFFFIRIGLGKWFAEFAIKMRMKRFSY